MYIFTCICRLYVFEYSNRILTAIALIVVWHFRRTE